MVNDKTKVRPCIESISRFGGMAISRTHNLLDVCFAGWLRPHSAPFINPKAHFDELLPQRICLNLQRDSGRRRTR